MKNLVLTIGLALMTLTSGLTFANEQICGDVDLQKKVKSFDNSIAFGNYGGLADGGVCWWHSRWQRNATYLAYFSPDKPKPAFRTESERKEHGVEELSIKEIIKIIKKGDKVVEIPGYENLNDFTAENSGLVQDTLEGWQKEDGFLNQKWLLGLFRENSIKPSKLKRQMDKLYQSIQEGNIVYQMLQLKGVTAHAWLVVGMEKTQNGYELQVKDSNFSTSIARASYINGSGTVTSNWTYGQFAPHTGNRGEERGLKKARAKFCKNLER